MGCGHSKPKLPRGGGGGVRASTSAAVELCRDRSALLAEAIARRYALADAHHAYATSLSATGAALHDFIRAVQDATPPPLPGPDEAPGEDADAPAPAAAVMAPTPIPAAPDAEEADDDDDHGHLQFCSDKGETTDDREPSVSPRTTEQLKQETPAQPPQMSAPPPPQPPQMAASPIPQPPQAQMAMPMPHSSAYRPTPQPAAAAPYGSSYPPPQAPSHYAFDYPPPPYTYSSYSAVDGPAYGYGGSYEADMGDGFGQSSYDISYTQSHPPPPLVSYHQGRDVTDATVRYHYHHGQGRRDAVPSSHSHYAGYPPYQYYYSQSSQQGEGWPPVSASSSHQMPPSSPAPMESAWGFLDPFEAFEGCHQDHPTVLASQSSNDVIRGENEDMPELEEDEDIPELEDEECTSSATISEDKEEEHIEFKESSLGGTSSSNGSNTVHGNRMEEDNNAVEEQLEERSRVVETEPPVAVAPEKVYNNDVEVVQEIKLQFEHASMSAGDVCKILEVGKLPHSQNNYLGLKVSSMMICGAPLKRKMFLKFEEEKVMECGNLSSSLQKLYCWEKKLLQEVKSTEKIRALHDQKRKAHKKLYDSGAEAHKLEEVEVSIKKLLSKIDVAIRFVNTISDKINKLRDEELWPQIHEVIRGFMQMWDALSKCHQIQCHAMSQAKNIDSTMAAAKFSKAHMDLVKQLVFQLMDMTTSFATWFNAQKSYAITLNVWLKRGIKYELEVTEDGVVPFSPRHLGAPPIFTICNSWAACLERISDAEVVGTMQALTSSVLGLWEKHRSVWRKDVLAHSDLDRDLRAMDRDDLRIHKAVEAWKKKLELVLGQRGLSVSNAHAVQDDAPPLSENGMQLCMSKLFEAMENFTTACGDAYKDLNNRSEEEKASFAAATCSKPKLPRCGERASAAVELCRDRSALLAEAIARRYALADAHHAYAASLCATGAALHDFLRASSYNINYTQSHPSPSLVSYHQGRHDTDATSRNHYHQVQGQRSYTIPGSHSGYGGYPPYQYYSHSSQQGDGWPPVSASSSHQLPPPMESAWGFLDPFEALEGYYQADHPAAPPTQSWNDVSDVDEDMPELEEDEDIPEVEEEECTCGTPTNEVEEEEHIEFKDSSSDATTSNNGSNMVHGNGVEEDNNAVEEQVEEHSGVVETEPPVDVAPEQVYNNDVEIVQEIKLQFENSSKAAGDLCKMLEVGKVPHSQKNSGFKVSSIMIYGVPSKRKKFVKFEEEKAMECGNLSSSLQQLYWWEKKLLQEVKSTEKIRALYEKKHKTLKKLYDNGAEAHKLEEVEVFIKKLLSKMVVAMHIVNNISNKIIKLRDEELWPQTYEVIRGFMQMWASMIKCHKIQCNAMSQAKNIDSNMVAAIFNEAHMHLVKQLVLQLLDMTTCFAAWFRAQKSYAITLNEWLKRGIQYDPEVTDDGVVPFSPGRLGASPIFTIFNSWATSLGRISDAEVVGAMQALASSVLGLWEKHRSEQRKGVLAHSTDLDRDLRAMDRDDLWMHRAVDARNKKLVLICGHRGVCVSAAQDILDAPPSAENGLLLCMSKVFEEMESFATACGDAYKDLHLRSEEEKASFATATCVDPDKHMCFWSGGQEEASVAAACDMNTDVVLKCRDTGAQHVGVQIDADGECAAHT
ncbi:hypothetical protein U9M48_002406 [Paspalum notatum var. saurae]|uniref:Uncharacterized protein n=1 Tax=Paspalum notatum var. saurae TaxID=547442 RepID=A0AAQ3PQI2_PASNO